MTEHIAWISSQVTVCPGLMESMKAADQNNWSMNPEQFADLAASLRNFFTKTGINQSCLDAQQQYTSSASDSCEYITATLFIH